MFDVEGAYSDLQEDIERFWSHSELDIETQEIFANDPEAILDEDSWSRLMAVACPPPGTSPRDCKEVVSLIISGLKYWSLRSDRLVTNEDSAEACREALEKYLLLTRLHITRLDADVSHVQIKLGRVKLGDIGAQLQQILAAVSRTIQSALSTLYPPTMTAKRATLALLYLEPTCKLLQHQAATLDKDVVREVIRVLALGVKLQHQQQMVHTQMLQLLTYFDHTVSVVVAFLYALYNEFDTTTLADGVLRGLTREASTWKDSQSSANISRAKTVNSFLVSLSECMPSIMTNNISAIAELLSSPLSKLRLGTIEIAPIMVKTIMDSSRESQVDTNQDDETSESMPKFSLTLDEDGAMRFKPAFELVKVVVPRVNDVNHYVRAKALWALAEICREPSMISFRGEFSQIAVKKMMDKSQYVRKQAMSFMKQLIDTHPQLMHPKNLSRKVWTNSLKEVENQLEVIDLNSTTFQQLEAGKAFIEFTLDFVGRAEEALGMAQALLNSRSKTDILDAISLLVYGDAYNIEASEAGIRSIVHLVWAKADNDENNQVSQTAVNTYKDLFLSVPPEYTPRQSAQAISENLIYLTLNANNGTLTSLEQLMVLALDRSMIDVSVVSRLWGIYQTEMKIDKSKRRGAAIVLSMLASADSSVARSGVGALVNVGLKKYAKNDYILGAYTFIILKRAIPQDTSSQNRLPSSYDTFTDIIEFLSLPAPEKRGLAWIMMAKEALSAIATICSAPSKVYTRLIRKYLRLIFGDEKETFTSKQRAQLFTQLIYIVGEVALNLLVFCDRCEVEFKKEIVKTASEGSDQQHAGNHQTGNMDEEELMASGASPEDDFQDIIRDFRENIIFYSDKALLKPFTGMVTEICKTELLKNSKPLDLMGQTVSADSLTPANLLPDEYLENLDDVVPDSPGEQSFSQSIVEAVSHVVDKSQPSPLAVEEFVSSSDLLTICATQTFSKFMCVSSRFCEENLPLLVSLMTHHPNNVVRSNFVVALGDVAICFNRLIDDHTEYLYDRLNDSEEVVQRTCIVALTFLILAGQIKIKGKLGEIAKTIVHPNEKMSSLAKMFFNELSGKENAIYNSYLDIISTLVNDVSLPGPKMNLVIRFLTQRLDKEKQMKKLSEKLLLRMKKAETEREWGAYVQGLTSMNHKLDDDIKSIIETGFTPLPGQKDEKADFESSEEEDEANGDEADGDEAGMLKADGVVTNGKTQNTRLSQNDDDMDVETAFVSAT